MGQTSEGDLARFYDASGKEVPLVRGRIFIQVVPTGTSVTGRARSEALICQGVIPNDGLRSHTAHVVGMTRMRYWAP